MCLKMEVLYGQKCRASSAEMEVQRNSGVLSVLRIWHIESMDDTYSRVNPKAVVIDWKTRLYTGPKYSVAATETKWE